MGVVYISYSVDIHRLHTDLETAKLLESRIKSLVFEEISNGELSKKLNFRNHFDSDIEVTLEEHAGDDSEL